MNLFLFEDRHVDQLWPITLGRSAAMISCGGCHLADWGTARDGFAGLINRPYLHGERSPCIRLNATPFRADAPNLLLNARTVPLRRALEQLPTGPTGPTGQAAWNGQQLVAATLPAGHPLVDQLHQGSLAGDQVADQIRSLESKPWPLRLARFEHPHDVVRYHAECLDDNLRDCIAKGPLLRELESGVFAAPDAVWSAHVAADTSQGPIVLHSGARVESHAYLCGPLWLGEQSIVRSHASLRGGVSLGFRARIGGEVQNSIIESYSNKQHYGFLGHSYLGSWINLGAGTSNSNLKNSYGSIKMQYGSERTDTGMTFLGCIMGDHVKSAIHTSIFSGKTIGPGSMLYGFVTENVPAFTNFARQFGDVTEVALESILESERRMMARRDRIMTEHEEQILRVMFELTRDQRQELPCRPPRFTR